MKERICTLCKKNKLESSFCVVASFKYKGMDISAPRNKEECCACARQRWISDFERVIKPINFIAMTSEGIKVDWNIYHRLVKEQVNDVRVENKVEIANKVLLSLGVITLLEAGTYEVVGTGSLVPSETNKIHNYNPQDWFSNYRFETEQDAIDYATAMIKEFMFFSKIKIREIGNVIILDNSK